MRLNKQQMSLVRAADDRKIFLEGIAGSGKTTVGTRRLLHWLDEGVRAEQIMVLVPQRTLADPYAESLKKAKKRSGGEVSLLTIGGLALHMVELFWPMAAEAAGFAHPNDLPQFLSLEAAQYYMTRIVGPEIDKNDYFNTVHLDRNRLYSQILDNLNKAAVVGFSYETIGERLKSAWRGEVSQQHIYDEAQICASLFRQFCLQHNLLDFSLQIEVFIKTIWPLPAAQRYLHEKFQYLIVDNIEEDNPATHGLLASWLPHVRSALIICDQDAGFRRFLGSDPENALRLKALCDESVLLERSYVMSPKIERFSTEIARSFPAIIRPESKDKPADDPGFILGDFRFHPQMVNWISDEIRSLVQDEGIPPGEIIVVAPFLSDALRFAFVTRLQQHGIPVRSHRPSRALRDEPATRAMMVWARIAHPQWNMSPSLYDIVDALTLSIEGMDLVRARLLSEITYRKGRLGRFDALTTEIQQRITFELGAKFDSLVDWLAAYEAEDAIEIDVFFSRLFGEKLSQPGYGFHRAFDDARTAANLIDSAREFRWTVQDIEPDLSISAEYIRMVSGGVLANQYLRDWQQKSEESVLLAPAYTFLMSNQSVAYQFWVNVGSSGWAQRLYQPLTHPYVLSLQWPQGQLWTDEDENHSNQQALYDLMQGLVRRCSKRLVLGYSQLSEQGFEQGGMMMDVIQRTLRRLARETTHD